MPAYSHGELNDVKSIAQGTTSTVSTATLHGLTVAVKTLKPPAQIAEPLTRERAPEDFQNELFINAHLRHPNILLFIGCIRRTGLQSLVFEYCQGGSLKCASYGYARLLESLNVCIGVARALCFAHSLGILHRDVKPSQVLMQGDTPKLGDWGLACISRNGGCHSGETGTWEYVSFRSPHLYPSTRASI